MNSKSNDKEENKKFYAERTEAEKAENAREQAEAKARGEKYKPKYGWSDMSKWAKHRLICSALAFLAVFGIFLAYTCTMLYQDRAAEDSYWSRYLEEDSDLVAAVDAIDDDAVRVETAVYLDEISSVDLKNSSFSAVINVGFRWKGDPTLDFSEANAVHFYKGDVDEQTLMNDHRGEDAVDGYNYQQIKFDVTINNNFWTVRFPLNSYQLRIYLEPTLSAKRLVLVPNQDESYTNTNIEISGYKLRRFAVAQTIYKYDHSLLNPALGGEDDEDVYRTQIMTQIEINRDGLGLYFKCFLAMFGTLAWILLCLYVATFRRVDALGMVGSAFFGAVSNLMVGAALVPDALQLGLLEYGNIFGVGIIVAGTMVVIAINAVRKERGSEGFARLYGRVMLVLFTVVVVAGNILLPWSAMMPN